MEYQKYFYIIGIGIFIPLWLILFFNKESRKDMLLFGTLIGILATIVEHTYAKLDYWEPVFLFPKFPFEDFLYGFIFGGISTEIYELVFKRKNTESPTHPTYRFSIIVFAFLISISFWLIVDVLKLNSIIAHIVPPLFVGLTVSVIRKDLLVPGILNGLVLAALTLIMFKILLFIYPEIFINHWFLENLSGLFIVGIPVEELLFAFVVGFGAGNVYEFMFGYSIKNKNDKITTKLLTPQP